MSLHLVTCAESVHAFVTLSIRQETNLDNSCAEPGESEDPDGPGCGSAGELDNLSYIFEAISSGDGI